MSDRERRTGVLGQVRNPLIFFALALLVIEGIIGSVVAVSQMSGGYQFAAVCLMAALFLVVVVAVVVITIKWPQHLYEDVIRDIESNKRAAESLETSAFRDSVGDIVESMVKPDCLKQSSQGDTR